MQSRDEVGNIVQTALVDTDKKLISAMQSAKEKGAVSHTIGELPIKGRIVELNGMVFEIKFVDFKRGEIRLKLLDDYKRVGDGSTIIKVRKKDRG